MRLVYALTSIFCAAGCMAQDGIAPPALSGRWRITEVIDSTGIHALSARESEAMVGKVIVFDDHEARFGNENCGATTYETTPIDREVILNDIRYAGPADTLLPDHVTQIDAGCAYVFLRTDGAILFDLEGDIFLAKKLKQPVGRNNQRALRPTK